MSGQAAAGLDAKGTSGVLAKLIAFSVLLGVAPISSYFLSLEYLWDGNATFAAITAIVTANAVLIGYIIMSVLEDGQGETPVHKAASGSESRKEK